MEKKIGLFFAIAILTGALFAGGNSHNFVDFPSLIMVLGITWGLMSFKYGMNAFRFWWLPNPLRAQIASWSGRTCLHVGVLSAIIGHIQIANNLTDMSKLGPALSVATMTIFYAYICYLFLFLPFTKIEVKVKR